MIPLAQFLTEFETDDGKPFGVADTTGPDGMAGNANARQVRPEPVFEHLSLVKAAPQAGAPSRPATSPLPLIEDETARLPALPAPANDETVSEKPAAAPRPAVPAAPAEDRAAIVAKAVEAALEKARAEAEKATAEAVEAAVAAALAEERARLETEKVAAVEEARLEARKQWAAGEGATMARLLRARLDEIESETRGLVGGVLRPLAIDARRRQTLTELAESSNLLIDDGKALSIVASGPADLCEALSEALGPRAGFVRFEPRDAAAELRVSCDATVIETRLQDWRTALEEALA